MSWRNTTCRSFRLVFGRLARRSSNEEIAPSGRI